MIPGITMKPTLQGLQVIKDGQTHDFFCIYSLDMARGVDSPAKLIAKVSGSADLLTTAVEYRRLAHLIGATPQINTLRQVSSAGTFEHVVLLPGQHRWPNWTVQVRQEIENVGPYTSWSRHYLDVRLPNSEDPVKAAELFIALCEYLEIAPYVTEMGLE